MTTLVLIVAFVGGAYVVAMIEGWTTTGRLRPAAPLVGAIALMGRESIVPRRPDRLLYELAPVLLLVSAALAAAVLPLSPRVIAVDMATSALFVNAAWAYVMVALVMAGWGPNGAYAMVAGWRFLGQLIAYAMLIVMPVATVAMRAESLSTAAIVRSQAGVWNIVTQPAGFVLFTLAAMAVAFIPPFDLPTAGSELAEGVAGEYTGVRLAIFRLARLLLVVTLATAVAVFYLGGWRGPLLPPWAWTAAKTLTVAAAMFFSGRFVPRIRNEHLLEWTWKFGIPLALANIAWVGISLWLVD